MLPLNVCGECQAPIDEPAESAGVHAGDAETTSTDEWAVGNDAGVRAVAGWVSRELRQYAVALRRLAYSQPNGVGETALLQLSEQLNTAADKGLADMLNSLGSADLQRRDGR